MSEEKTGLDEQKETWRLEAENLECAHMYLDDLSVPRSSENKDFSIVGRIKALQAMIQDDYQAGLKAAQWIPVSELPDLEIPVLVTYKHYPDSVTAAMRVGDSDGWAWAQLTGYNATLNDSDSYEFDDDYEYSHWMPLPQPPKEEE